jgi:alpha-L-rhamnosidase
MRFIVLLVCIALCCGKISAQVASPDHALDPTRHLPMTAADHVPLSEEYVWTAGEATAKRPDRAKFPWSLQSARTEPHYFRTTFSIASVPKVATLYIAGPREAHVYVNGKLLAHFSSNIDAPVGFRAFHADAASLLTRGFNTVAIEVVRGRGVVSGGGTLATAQLAYGEVLVAKILPAAAGIPGEPLMITNATWRSTVSAPDRWSDTGFDDRQWAAVESLGPVEGDLSFYQWSADAGMYGWPGYMGMSSYLRTFRLRAAQISHVYEGGSHFGNLDSLTAPVAKKETLSKEPDKNFFVTMPTVAPTDAESPSLLLDFGREVNGRLLVDSASNTGSVISIAYGESEIEAISTGLAPGQQGGNFLGTNLLDVPANGIARGPKSAFRFARITFLRGSPITTFRDIRVEGIYYPAQYRGSFESSDPLLNRIWETGAYTAHLCMQDDVWDAPKRDRGRWSGDLDISGRVISDVFGDSFLLEDTLRNLITGPGRTTTGIPSYTGLWITTLYDLYLHSGDRAFLATQHDNIVSILEGMDANLDASNVFTNPKHAWMFVDWSPGMNSYTEDARIGTQMQYVRAYVAGAALLSELGDTAASAKFAAQAKRVADSAIASYRNAKTKTYGNTWHLNTLAVLALGEESNHAIWDSVLSQVKQDSPTDEVVSPYFNAYVLDAMALMGHREDALMWMRKYWGGMLGEGATSFWEAYDLRWQKANPHLGLQADGTTGYFISMAHGWSAGPTAWLQREVLGIKPTSSGFNTVSIRPDLLDLAWVRGSTPTPNGPITLSLDAKTGIELGLPENEEAEVSVAVHGAAPVVLVNGASAAFTMAENKTRALIRLKAKGHYVITTR